MWSAATALPMTAEQKDTLLRWVHAPSTPQGVALRATIVLRAADGVSNNRSARECAVSRPTVILWRERFTEGGPQALTEIKEGRGRKPFIPAKKLQAIIHDTLHEKPADATHWSMRTMAKRHGVSHVFVKRVWDANGFKPHLVRTFKLSKDPAFVEKLTDVVGLYLNPPEHALVFSIDEKSQIQALQRTQPSLPLKRDRAGTITHDYKRNGTTTLFAAFDV